MMRLAHPCGLYHIYPSSSVHCMAGVVLLSNYDTAQQGHSAVFLQIQKYELTDTALNFFNVFNDFISSYISKHNIRYQKLCKCRGTTRCILSGLLGSNKGDGLLSIVWDLLPLSCLPHLKFICSPTMKIWKATQNVEIAWFWAIRSHPRSSAIWPFDRVHTTSCSTLIETCVSLLLFLPCDTMLAWCMLLSSVCLSFTNRCSTKMANYRTMQTTSHESPVTFNEIRMGSPNAEGVVIVGDFQQITCYNSKVVQDRCIVSIKVRQEVIYTLSNAHIACDLGWPHLLKPPQFLHFALPFIFS